MRLFALLALASVSVSSSFGAPDRDDFRMTVMDRFTITGRGLIITGIVEGGPVRVDDVVCFRPSDGEPRELTVAGIEMFREVIEVAEPGDAVGLLFTELERSDVNRGDELTASCE